MSTDLDAELRAALGELADTPPPPGLADGALAAARRRRRAGTVARVVVAAAAVLAAIPLATAVVRAGRDADTAQSPPGRMVVSGYGRLELDADGERLPPLPDLGNDYRSLVLDPVTGRYRELPFDDAALSPDGTRVLVTDGNNGVHSPFRVGVLDLATDEVRWISLTGHGVPLAGNPAAWSPDGDRILLQAYGQRAPDAFAVVDAATLAVTVTHVIRPESAEVPSPPFSWTPDGSGLVRTLYRGTVGERDADAATGLEFYDLRGRVARRVAVDAALPEVGGFAPDGRRAALSAPDDSGPIRVVDTATGAALGTVRPPEGGRFVGWYDDDSLVVFRSPEGRSNGRKAGGMSLPPAALDVVDLTGRPEGTISLPDRVTGVATVRLAPADLLERPGSATVL